MVFAWSFHGLAWSEYSCSKQQCQNLTPICVRSGCGHSFLVCCRGVAATLCISILTSSPTFVAAQPLLCTATGLLFVSLQTCCCGDSCLSRLASLTAVPVLLQICGEANVGVIREAAKAGVPRCAFISVHDYKFPGTANQHHRLVHLHTGQVGILSQPEHANSCLYVWFKLHCVAIFASLKAVCA